MSSRMERYHNQTDRSSRNKGLYKDIEDLDTYTNIEDVIAIDNTNEIDITKVKEILKDREGYQQEKRYQELLSEKEEQLEEISSEKEEDRTYDIRDVLTKAKETREEPVEEDCRVLKDTNYDLIKKLNLKAIPEEEETLKDLMDTTTIRNQEKQQEETKKSSEIESDSDDLGLLDDLKSDTAIGDPASIKKIIAEAREEEAMQEQDKEEIAELENLDKSFYTSSLGFTEDDFEDLKSLGEDIKKHNFLLRILIISVAVVALIIIAILCF